MWVDKLSKRKIYFYITQIKARTLARAWHVEGDEMSDRWGWLSWLQVLAALQFVALLAVCSRWDADVHHVVSRRLVVSQAVSDLLLWYDTINFYRCRRNRINFLTGHCETAWYKLMIINVYLYHNLNCIKKKLF